jgi:UDP-N-acetylglucosamine acyltransferase
MPIHSTAIISAAAEIHPTAVIGPYAVIDEDVIVHENVRIGPFVHLFSGAVIERDVQIFDGACISAPAQDLKAHSGLSKVWIGPRSKLREFVTVHRSAHEGGVTRIGADSLIMAYAHVAHDCVLGERSILANGVQLGGHVHIGCDATVSGMTGVHQFTRIGSGAFVAGSIRVDQDIPPFAKAIGIPLRLMGTNLVGLRRWGWNEIARRGVEKALRHKASSQPITSSDIDFKEWPVHALKNWNDFWNGESRRGICLKGLRPIRG